MSGACVVSFQTAEIKRGQRLWTNSGCATMGYDLPASIGVCAARGKDKRVICIAGDGSIMMNIQEMQTIAGPWMIRDRHGFRLSGPCFVHGWESCPAKTRNTRIVQQVIAGLRWIWLNYGRPKTAWATIEHTGRFTSYPRTGTDDRATSVPFAAPAAPSASSLASTIEPALMVVTPV